MTAHNMSIKTRFCRAWFACQSSRDSRFDIPGGRLMELLVEGWISRQEDWPTIYGNS